jgi:ABC-type Zn uptake system ZnuABC Zn-binding protein ZnuA
VKKLLIVGISLLVIASLGITVLAKPTIVATHAVFGEFVQVAGGDLVEVVTIIPSGFCPAHYDLCPSDVAAVSRATMILYSGVEPWMESLLDAVGGTATVLQLGGLWSTPAAAAEKVDAIAAALSELLPDNAETFAVNATAYKEDLASLATSLKEKAATLNVENIPVISMAWQEDFVVWLGFNIVATYGMPENLSLKDLVELAQVGRDNEAVLVIGNLQSGVNFGAKLAREIGAVHVVLSNFPGAMPWTATVLDLFERNAEALFSAIEPLP